MSASQSETNQPVDKLYLWIKTHGLKAYGLRLSCTLISKQHIRNQKRDINIKFKVITARLHALTAVGLFKLNTISCLMWTHQTVETGSDAGKFIPHFFKTFVLCLAVDRELSPCLCLPLPVCCHTQHSQSQHHTSSQRASIIKKSESQ